MDTFLEVYALKRTAEFVLSIIGVIIIGLVSVLFIALGLVAGNRGFQGKVKDLLNSNIDDPSAHVSQIDISIVFDKISTMSWVFVVCGVIALLLGLIGVYFLKGNKHPTIAGILLIIGALLGTFGTYFVGFIAGILFLIAGIMCLARKGPPTTSDPSGGHEPTIE